MRSLDAGFVRPGVFTVPDRSLEQASVGAGGPYDSPDSGSASCGLVCDPKPGRILPFCCDQTTPSQGTRHGPLRCLVTGFGSQ